MEWKKQEWPGCADLAINYIHAQCQKFSQSGVPSPAQLTSLIEIIDEFIFSYYAPPGKSGKRRAGRLSSIQQLQLVQVLADYFTGEHDFNLLCSVFMIVFMVQGREVEYKVSQLARLLSYSLSVHAVTILNFGGVWLTQQGPASPHSLAVARHLVQDWVSCSRHTHLHSLPAQSPLFTTNLIAAIGEVYSGLGSQDPAPAPPQQVVALVTAWLRAGHEAGGGEGRGPGVPRVPVPGTSPAASLLPWSVFSGLDSEDSTSSSALHHTLVDLLLCGPSSPLPSKYLTHLTEGLLARLGSSQHPPAQVEAALDRFGQLVAAALAGGNLKLDKDLVTLINKLPSNRLVSIVLKNNTS